MGKITELDGWTALPEAADKIGMSRQGLHFRVNQGLVPEKYVRAIKTGKRQLVLIGDAYIKNERRNQQRRNAKAAAE